MGAAPSGHLLRTLASVSPSSRILDLGCGTGRHTVALAALGFDYYACDPAADAVAATRAALDDAEADRRVTQARTEALGYPDDFADWVIAFGAYDDAEHMAALVDRMAETRRVLKPGGWIYVAMRASSVGEEATPEALTALWEQAGFALAEAPAREDEGEPVLRGIYRKIDAAMVR